MECLKCFKDLSYLTKHSKIHSNLRDFQCIQCSNAFNFKTDLDKHAPISGSKQILKLENTKTLFTRLKDCFLASNAKRHSKLTQLSKFMVLSTLRYGYSNVRIAKSV